MKVKSIIASALAICSIGLCFASCAEKEEHKTSVPTPDNAVSNTMIENGKSDYVLLVPETVSGAESVAAQTIQSCLYTSTACKVRIVNDKDYTPSAFDKVISIGRTKAFADSGIAVDEKGLNGDGYVIKSVNEDIFIIAGTKDLAYQYAAYGLLHELIAYEAYSYDEIYFDYLSGVAFSAFDITEIPVFTYRFMYNEEMAGCPEASSYRDALRNSDIVWAGPSGHTIFKLLPPEKYAKDHSDWYINPNDPVNGQLCWSKQDMLAEMTVQVIDKVKNTPNATHVMVAQNDGRDWCVCKDCSASLNQYGTNSAVLIKGMNYIARELNKYLEANEPGREVIVTTFAYTSTEKPPVKLDGNGKYVPIDDSVVLEKNVGVRIAPIDTDYARSFYDSANEVYATNFRGWSALTNNIAVWNYNTNFSFYFVPFCNFNTIQDNYRFFSENGVSAVMEQGAGSKQVGFIPLRNYVYSKLMWNPNEDFEELIDNFFDNYYQDGASAMRKYFDEYRSWYNVIENQYLVINGGIYAGYGSVFDVFPLNLISRWEGYVEQAKKEIEYIKVLDETLYEKIYNRIDVESLFFDYVRLTWYNTSYSDSELLALRLQFKEKCEKYDIKQIKEAVSLASVYEGWGI